MSNEIEESPTIPSYEEFKQRLTAALNNSETNWSKRKMVGLEKLTHPAAPAVNQYRNLCPYTSRIYQRRMARKYFPYGEENVRQRWEI